MLVNLVFVVGVIYIHGQFIPSLEDVLVYILHSRDTCADLDIDMSLILSQKEGMIGKDPSIFKAHNPILTV